MHAIYSGPLTYSAIGDDDLSPWHYGNYADANITNPPPPGTGDLATQVSFWENPNISYVGIDEYSALSNDNDTALNGTDPTLQELVNAWEQPFTDDGNGTPTDTTADQTQGQSLIQYYESVATATGKPLLFTAFTADESPACYVAGTLILTNRGERAVETLAIGDMVVTASGQYRPVIWIGRRSYAEPFLASNPRAQPIRFCAGSLGDGLSRRDLLVSPEHAMVLDGLLIPARCLVNGRTIVQACGLDRVEYCHIELDSHDILLAEGAPSESFMASEGRGVFRNGHEFDALYPGAVRSDGFCAPLVEQGFELEVIWQRLTRAAGEVAAAA